MVVGGLESHLGRPGEPLFFFIQEGVLRRLYIGAGEYKRCELDYCWCDTLQILFSYHLAWC